uniref:Uncharacterized protein n=1 Tax=Lepeophtheirus salmonis TaxID=72036 RepID=A0A0K2U3M6_LEPSM
MSAHQCSIRFVYINSNSRKGSSLLRNEIILTAALEKKIHS